MKNIITVEEEDARKAYLEEMEEAIGRMEDAFEKCSEGDAFFGGKELGFVDIAFGSYLGWLRVMDTEYGGKLLVESKNPKLFKWAYTFADHHAVKGLIPETQSLIQFSKYLQTKWRDALSH